jgi:hypothetical protein
LQLAVDGSNKLQGFFLGLPSLSRPFQRAGGRLFPFGFLHILRGFKQFDTVDFYFAGVHPQSCQLRNVLQPCSREQATGLQAPSFEGGKISMRSRTEHASW